jgi:hypothetical protein
MCTRQRLLNKQTQKWQNSQSDDGGRSTEEEEEPEKEQENSKDVQ